MKTRKSASTKKSAAAKDPAATSKRKVRRRQTGVRSRVLGLLTSGSLTSSELVTQGGFSAASLYLNLKTLKKEGLVETSRNGRNVSISLTESGTAAASAEPMEMSEAAPKTPVTTGKKRGRKPGTKMAPKKAAAAPRDLHAALEGLVRLFAPIDRVEEKLLVLEQVARSMPAPVASVLQDIKADLARLTSGRSA